ncbi:MAG: LPS export ABC transporter periplasmic protein LptC [bacterium]
MAAPLREPLPGLLRQNFKELLVLLILGGLLAAGTAYFFKTESIQTTVIEEQGTLVLTGVTIHDFQRAIPRWKLRGNRAIVLEDSQRMRLESVMIEVFQERQSAETPPVVELTIEAREGLVEWRSNRITLLGDVVVRQVSGPRVFTEAMVYDLANEFLNLPKPVRIEEDGSLLLGESLTYQRSQNLLSVKQPTALTP